jgi:hypothetical protein
LQRAAKIADGGTNGTDDEYVLHQLTFQSKRFTQRRETP